jgi:hypothetical protein
VIRAINKWIIAAAQEKAEEYFSATVLSLPRKSVGRILIYGGDVFYEEVAAALASLRARDDYHYRLVQRYIRAIVQADRSHRSGQILGVRYQPIGDSGRLPLASNRFAALLVRDAVVLREIRGFGLSRSSKANLVALTHELRTMDTLSCHPKYIEHQKQELMRISANIRKKRPWMHVWANRS